MGNNIFIQHYASIKRQFLKNNPYSCLIGANIDINPHQVEGFCAAVASLKTGGIILADEVGLGKTIEAGLVLKYVIQNGGKRILLIMPSNLRKQWQIELEEKFNIYSIVVDSYNIDDYYDKVNVSNEDVAVIICSYNYASKKADLLSKTVWDFIIFDEAHKLRNVHKSGIKTAKNIYQLTKGIPKILLTATPIQNNLLDLYGLVYFIDDKIFFDKQIYAKRYLKDKNYEALKEHIKPVIQRTLRKDVAYYLSFKERTCITVDFKLSQSEAILYKLINDYLKRDILYSIPSSNRTLITVVIRKLLASSSYAVAETFEVLKERLKLLKESTRIENVDKGLDYFFSYLDDDSDEEEEAKFSELYDKEKVNEFIQHEIEIVENIIRLAKSIDKNAKASALFEALSIAFIRQKEFGINEKVVIFTESVRTQEYLFNELIRNGYENEVLIFNGSNSDKQTGDLYKAWKAKNFGKVFGSRNVEVKHAIVDYFKTNCKILLLTDAGSEGLNLQFCNTVINYDLPWNPQKIEQRIGRCHRYGQKNDTVVINLLNTENLADRRVYEILSQKFMLFEGVFGASDQALGLLESGMDFEKRILQIYQSCDSIGEFNKEFKSLEKEFDRKRNTKFKQLRSLLADNDENIKSKYFKEIISEITDYLDENEDLQNIDMPDMKMDLPAAFKLESYGLNKYNLNHGYIFIGGFYNNDKLIYPVLNMFDENKNKIYLDQETIISIIKNINDNTVTKINIKENEVEKCADDIYSDLMLKYYSQNKNIIEYTNSKISNWCEIRKEQFNMGIETITSEIEEMKSQCAATKNFKEKVDYKRQAEEREKERNNIIIKYHEAIEAIENEADKIKQDFKKQFDINPFLIARLILKF
ncbi:DISARM system SNF2-like helicase DrmD [Clostridium pasteurianum]|uniref:DNA/RNA helicase, superfamily II, SNF2 family n=1 Tax=Clostridium pasteurianum BC1 TaxID=86416 RepID=R4K5Z5_CLOPA|nr:DISARM system SNF2-like helicase DrmD [Clostridium pasteurianum]AGK97121.1 DNA/RNA helicase, superfamily II, SNF2 family [Clostridium pasteurianum BC1]